MTDYVPTCTLEDAQYCFEQAKSMLERARFMWSQANKTVKETQSVRDDLHVQITELTKCGAFRPRFIDTLLAGILDAAVEATAADMGNIQLLDAKTGHLLIHLQRGFKPPFLEFFNSVHANQAACGTALKCGQRVVVPDVADSPVFSANDCLEIMLDAGVRAVQSTPLIAKSGRLWGMLSTHYRNVHHPGKKDLRLIDYFADWAAELLDTEFRAAHPRANSPSSTGGNSASDVLSRKNDYSVVTRGRKD